MSTKKHCTISRLHLPHPFDVLGNLVLVYLIYIMVRVPYLIENWGTYADHIQQWNWAEMLRGCFAFDTAALFYFNGLYILLALFPLHMKEQTWFYKMLRYLFVLTNTMAVAMNLSDAVYYKYTGRRTTATVFQEFANEDNLAKIFVGELLVNWWIVVFGLLLCYVLWRCFFFPKTPSGTKRIRYYSITTASFITMGLLAVIGVRGGATKATRPITISNANKYVSNPADAALILNTPFSIIRTLGKQPFIEPKYFSSEELDTLYNPVHQANSDSIAANKRNIVVLIVESFGREYIGAYNKTLEDGKYKGYTPFIDSLITQSLTFEQTYCNGRKSIDGMPAILASIPYFVEPFVLTPASLNKQKGLPGCLNEMGYETAFFHGAQNGSMGFDAFARATGFQHYYGRTEYDADKRFNGEKDFDGTWAIWDEPFLQFYAQKMNEMQQPFMTSIFTASSHEPYHIPQKYKEIYPEEGGNPIHKCIRYVDQSLRKFFDTAKHMPWYKNTLFVITSDHTNTSTHAEYQTTAGVFASPIIIFDPAGEIKPGRAPLIAQHIDIMPTLLDYVGYNHPYIAFGKNLFNTNEQEAWAVNYANGIYQYLQGNYLLQFDGTRATAIYNLGASPLMKENIIDRCPSRKEMEQHLKAIIQSYMHRMNTDDLIVEE